MAFNFRNYRGNPRQQKHRSENPNDKHETYEVNKIPFTKPRPKYGEESGSNREILHNGIKSARGAKLESLHPPYYVKVAVGEAGDFGGACLGDLRWIGSGGRSNWKVNDARRFPYHC